MACASYTLTGIANDCATSMGGIKKVWIAPYSADAATVTSNKVSAVSGLDSFKGFEFKKNVCSMTSTLNVDAANGINYVSTELVLQFNKMDSAKRIEIQALALNDCMVIVLDSNGTYWFLGLDEPVAATAGTGQTGAAKGDGNYYQITLTDESIEFPHPIDATALEDLD